MKLLLKTVAKKDKYTIGKLYIDGVYFCDTLEDTSRGLTQSMKEHEISKIKVHGNTAIPTGTYKITLNIISPKFSKYKQYKFCEGKLPRLLDVPGFEGVLIHIGNTPKDTEGCILVGYNKVVGGLINSTIAFKALYSKLLEAKNNNEEIIIEKI